MLEAVKFPWKANIVPKIITNLKFNIIIFNSSVNWLEFFFLPFFNILRKHVSYQNRTPYHLIVSIILFSLLVLPFNLYFSRLGGSAQLSDRFFFPSNVYPCNFCCDRSTEIIHGSIHILVTEFCVFGFR